MYHHYILQISPWSFLWLKILTSQRDHLKRVALVLAYYFYWVNQTSIYNYSNTPSDEQQHIEYFTLLLFIKHKLN